MKDILKEKGEMGCVPASMAALSGLSYKEVKRLLQRLPDGSDGDDWCLGYCMEDAFIIMDDLFGNVYNDILWCGDYTVREFLSLNPNFTGIIGTTSHVTAILLGVPLFKEQEVFWKGKIGNWIELEPI